MRYVDIAATGENIRYLMNKNNIDAKSMMVEFGFNTPRSIYKWMNGENLPDISNLIIMSDLFDVRIDNILIIKDGKDESKNQVFNRH